MPHAKLNVGEAVEVYCYHRGAGGVRQDWLLGRVVQTDSRMAAIQFDCDVYSNNGWLIPDRVLWCAHGSPHLRRIEDERA